jgi:hypothetical protein
LTIILIFANAPSNPVVVAPVLAAICGGRRLVPSGPEVCAANAMCGIDQLGHIRTCRENALSGWASRALRMMRL